MRSCDESRNQSVRDDKKAFDCSKQTALMCTEGLRYTRRAVRPTHAEQQSTLPVDETRSQLPAFKSKRQFAANSSAANFLSRWTLRMQRPFLWLSPDLNARRRGNGTLTRKSYGPHMRLATALVQVVHQTIEWWSREISGVVYTS